MDKIKLLGEKVLVEVESQSKTAGGLVVAESGEAVAFRQGKVVAVGPGKIFDNGTMKEMEVLVEDTVLFNYGQEVTLDGKKYWLTSETDIAVIFTA